MNRAAVERRAGATLGGEQHIAHRVVDDAKEGFALVFEGDRDGEHRKAVREVGRAVERVNYPSVIRATIGQPAFFAEHLMARIVRSDSVTNQALAGQIDVGDKVDVPLVAYVYACADAVA